MHILRLLPLNIPPKLIDTTCNILQNGANNRSVLNTKKKYNNDGKLSKEEHKQFFAITIIELWEYQLLT